MADMKKCDDCKLEFPSDLVVPFQFGDSRGFLMTVQVDPICAYRRMSKLHGVPCVPNAASAPQAKRLYDRAVKFNQERATQ